MNKTLQRNGIIIKGIGGFYYVKTADGVLECKAKGIFRKRGITPLAGDNVTVDGEGEDLVISEISQRKNAFVRPPVANVDNLILIVSATDPRPNILVIDKLTAIAQKHGIKPVIVLTKTDIEPVRGFITIYTAAGFDVIDLRKNTRRGLREVKARCNNALSVFVGNSGVGKTTLLNELCPGLELETAETSKKLGRGKHTTRAVELYDYEGGFLADTPGFSDVDFARDSSVEKQELAGLFPDFAPYIDNCYFTGCSHTVEKGCAVLRAMAEGKVQKSRHESYTVLYNAADKSSR